MIDNSTATRPAVELVALDIAGTTVDEEGAVYRSLGEAVREAGGRPSAAEIERWMGASKPEAVRALLRSDGTSPDGRPEPSSELVGAVFADFRRRLQTSYHDHPPVPYAAVPEMLETLRKQGIRVALTTGFDRDITGQILTALDWRHDVVDTVVCADDVTSGRPAPYLIFVAMERLGVHRAGAVLAAGDTVRDVEAGRNAGAGRVVAVLTGGVARETLAAAGPTDILDSVSDLVPLLDLTRTSTTV